MSSAASRTATSSSLDEMLVYGDRLRTRRPQDLLTALARDLALPPGDGCRDHLTGALILAGELAQGLADAEFETLGEDDLTPLQSTAMALCTAVARRLLRGEDSGEAELSALAACPLPAEISCKVPEGYAFYAVYPQCYAEAAVAQAWAAPPLVIGLRSIGASLAAAVAAVTNGRAITLRPCGHPYARRIRASSRLKATLAAHAGPYVIVDEGPGLSGSSFGGAADLLDELGAPRERIVFMPSHSGAPGPEASPSHRARWATASRRLRTFEDLQARDPIGGWFADLIGEARSVDDFSAGAWRAIWPGAAKPPAAPRQERRKFRLTTDRGVFLARFAGLGGLGEAKFTRAQALARAGFTPEPVGLRRGFLLERWVSGGALEPGGAGRAAFLDHLARYLGFRARELPAPDSGASLSTLLEMAAQNVGELCGPMIAAELDGRLRGLFTRAGRRTPVHIDGRLHAWEWCVRADGRICKTDALDHSEAHDLVGPQDIAWDVAGAAVEFALSPEETETLAARVGELAGRALDRPTLAGFMICYPAFQGALWTLAQRGVEGTDLERLRAQSGLYANHLRRIARLQRPAAA